MPEVGEVVGTKAIDRVYNGVRIRGTVTYIYDPEAVNRALDMWADCLIDALPGILARKQAAEEQSVHKRQSG